MIFGLYLLWKFNVTKYFSMPWAVLTVGASTMGVLLIIAAITLHGLKRMSEKMNRVHVDSKR